MSTKITHFRVTQVMDVHSADCHSVKEYAMSNFGQEELPKHIKIEIVKAAPAPAPAVNAANVAKAVDGQADKPAA